MGIAVLLIRNISPTTRMQNGTECLRCPLQQCKFLRPFENNDDPGCCEHTTDRNHEEDPNWH